MTMGGQPLNTAEPRRISKTITFTGAAGVGDVGSVPIYTVTGEIEIIRLVPYCTVNLGEAAPTATIALGVTGATSFFVAATDATAIDAGDAWFDTTPTEFVNAYAIPAGFKDIWCTDNIIGTVAAQAVNSGAIRFDLIWRPLSSDGVVS